MRVLVTGCAGFIGHAFSKALLAKDYIVVGVDNLNSYYSVSLKKQRLADLQHANFTFIEADIADSSTFTTLGEFDYIVHLAAQAGVRYSFENPAAYGNSNLIGHLNILEFAKGQKHLQKLVYASSSSVYGNLAKKSFIESETNLKPISLYAATKLSCELMSEAYFHSYGLSQAGLRFFTVYGPWGRPDMAPFKFAEAIFKQMPIDVYNNGEMWRDFTYIDDIVAGIYGAMLLTDSSHAIFNLGNNGRCTRTCANIDKASASLNYSPKTQLAQGLTNLCSWYKEHYK
jgi:UDP-glucuronate 4-epimerase